MPFFSCDFSGECPPFFPARVLSFLGFVRTFFGERTFGSKHFCLLFVFWCCLAYFLPSLFGFYLPKPDRKNFHPKGALSQQFSGANFWVRGTSVCYLCFGAVFSYVLPSLFGVYLPKVGQKNSLYPRGAIHEQFSGANFWFDAFLSFICILVLFCLFFAIIIWI